MLKKILIKLMIVVFMASGVVVGTGSAANADLCLDVWTMRSKPTRICLIRAET
jgi:hypothetical protein